MIPRRPGPQPSPSQSILGPLCLACAACAEAPAPSPACDVLIISIDTVRADALTFLDEQASPNLFALAKRGVIFEQAIAGSSWTLPSHAELFTGLPPILHGVHDDGRRIDPAHPTLGEYLNQYGLHTAGVFSGWYLAGAYGFERGFESYGCALSQEHAADRALAAAISQGGTPALWAGDVRSFASHRDISSQRVLQLAQKALRETPGTAPLGMFVHFFDPHHDFIPPEPFDRKFDPHYSGTMTGSDYWNNRAVYDPDQDPGRTVTDRDLDHLRALYQGEIAWCDAAIGQLLDSLRESGRLDNTLIVVLSDHGEEFFEHGNRGHRQTLYDEVIRVPLLIVPPTRGTPETAGPAASPTVPRTNLSFKGQVSLSDVLPTVLDYLGAPPSPSCWGRSLRPCIEGRAFQERMVISSLALGATHGSNAPLLLLESFRLPGTKLIRRLRLSSGALPARVEDLEHFDLAADPHEQNNQAPVDRARLQLAWDALNLELESLHHFADRLPHSPAAELSTDVSQIFAAELNALGYAGDDFTAPKGESRWPTRPLPPLLLPALGQR